MDTARRSIVCNTNGILDAKRENADANLVRNFVRNLRRKLGESAASPTWLFNERGVGYRMAKPPNR